MRDATRVLVGGLLVVACATPPPSESSTAAAQPPTPSGSPVATGPPSAVLGVNGARRREGELGTYVYRGAGSDAPWLPARALDPVTVRSGDRLTVSLGGASLIGPWSATIAPAGDDQAERARALGGDETVGGLREAVELPVPPRGSWVLMVRLDYGDGSGSGAYFWLLNVS